MKPSLVQAPPRLSGLTDSAVDAFRSASAYLSEWVTPTVRLGVTGLARSGKTVFITALVRNLLSGGRLPFFGAYAEGRVQRTFLAPQPDDTVARFDYEAHLAALTRDPPEWPESTSRISQLRVTIEYTTGSPLWRGRRPQKLHLDIVDYPGEWLLDLALLDQGYENWAREAIALARSPERAASASAFLGFLAGLDPAASHHEGTAREGARLFTAYLRAQRTGDPGLSTAGPGRFLMPGDIAGSPLLTFFPVYRPQGPALPHGSLGRMLARRYDSYRTHVVKPFFRNHFSRLDRQIVLIDVLAALNGGQSTVADLTRALEACLKAFRPGANTWLSTILARRIDRILFAATKADHLAQAGHDRLETILAAITETAGARAELAGAETKVVALAALRATREAEAGSDRLPCILGVPLPGERLGATNFDGATECAVFPGDLPQTAALTKRGDTDGSLASAVRFLQFRPPRRLAGAAAWPHVRLDRALDFLIGDKLE